MQDRERAMAIGSGRAMRLGFLTLRDMLVPSLDPPRSRGMTACLETDQTLNRCKGRWRGGFATAPCVFVSVRYRGEHDDFRVLQDASLRGPARRHQPHDARA